MRPVEFCAANRGFAAFCVCFLLLVPRADDVHEGRVLRGRHRRTRTCRVTHTLTIAGLAECVFVGWVYGAERLRDETAVVSGHAFMGKGAYFPVTIKYVVPAALATMLSYQIAVEAREAYGGYPGGRRTRSGGGCAW